ncbi:sigma-70 family RNA polymerase sigma factor [Kitasatospora cinereorecta]|uniref:RNA polymerase sigma factor n=1 Tax=Kitasatospora cinereorecta TaxID=285560 RepID=A0ABW0VBA4_9ACTN
MALSSHPTSRATTRPRSCVTEPIARLLLDSARQVYREYHGSVFRYLVRRVGAEDAADLTAEVFTVVWRRLDALPAAAPLPWLYAVARNTMANHRRRAGRADEAHRMLAVGTSTAGRDVGEAVAERHLVHRAWASLRESDREVLALIGWEALTVREAATVLGCSAAACSVRLMRATTRLAKALAADSGDSDSDSTTETVDRSVIGVAR